MTSGDSSATRHARGIEQPPEHRLEPFLRSLEQIEGAIAKLRTAIETLEVSIAQTRELLEAAIDPLDLFAAPGTTSRDTTIEALNAMHSALMVSRGEWYRILIEDRGMSLSEIARHTGHPRQLIKRRYDALNKKIAQPPDIDAHASPETHDCRPQGRGLRAP